MRVVIAPDSFGGTLSAAEAAEAIDEGWQRGAPGCEVVTVPLSDGGPGFLEVIRAGLDAAPGPAARTLLATVPGPLARPVPAAILMHEATAYLESAQACGLHLMAIDERDPWSASSAGLGVLMDQARRAGAERLVIGLGGTGTVDGGAGMLGALGAQARAGDGSDATASLAGGPKGLDHVAWVDVAGIVGDLAGIEVIVAADVEVPLTGPDGAARGFAPQKFADAASVRPEDLERLEVTLTRFAGQVHGSLESADLTARPAAGAAGGIGWALLALGAVSVPGIDVVAAAVALDDHLAGADLVITGEGRLDWQSRRGKVIAGIAERASARAIPVVAIAGRVDLGGRELAALGIVEAWSLAEQPGGLARSMITPHEAVAEASARIARQWAGGPN